MSIPGVGVVAAVTGIAASTVVGLLSVLAADHGVPERAAQAYLVAAATAPCDLDYRTLTAVGAVESGHGTHGGSRLDADGRATGAIVSSAGASGPMQFMPGTWSQYATDGDGDGRADVDDIDDAAAAAAALLCASNVDENRTEAVGAYNGGGNWRRYAESRDYVVQVDERIGALPAADLAGSATAPRSAPAGPAPEWCGVQKWISAPGDCSRGLQGILAAAWAATGGALNDPETPQLHTAWAWLNGASPYGPAAGRTVASPSVPALAGSGGLQADFTQRLARMAGAAPGRVSIVSGYRSTAEQQAIVDRHGGECGVWVACVRDGVCGSMHCRGLAADVSFEDDATRAWAHAHVAEFGLRFPLPHEPWHVELAGARG